jgi:hypothetical protein
VTSVIAAFTALMGGVYGWASIKMLVSSHDIMWPPPPRYFWWGLGVVAALSLAWLALSYCVFRRQRWTCRAIAYTAIPFGVVLGGLAWHGVPAWPFVVHGCETALPMFFVAALLRSSSVADSFDR